MSGNVPSPMPGSIRMCFGSRNPYIVVCGFYTAADKMRAWGGVGAFWGGIWGLILASGYRCRTQHALIEG